MISTTNHFRNNKWIQCHKLPWLKKISRRAQNSSLRQHHKNPRPKRVVKRNLLGLPLKLNKKKLKRLRLTTCLNLLMSLTTRSTWKITKWDKPWLLLRTGLMKSSKMQTGSKKLPMSGMTPLTSRRKKIWPLQNNQQRKMRVTLEAKSHTDQMPPAYPKLRATNPVLKKLWMKIVPASLTGTLQPLPLSAIRTSLLKIR